MDEFKTLTQSKTFWGAVVALGGSALTFGHYTLTPADAASAVDLLSGLASAVGGLIAIYGRVMATHRIGAAIARQRLPPSAGPMTGSDGRSPL
jgi:hypothetical protein